MTPHGRDGATLVLQPYCLHLLVEVVLRDMLLVQTLVGVLDSSELRPLSKIRLVERVVSAELGALGRPSGSPGNGLSGALCGSSELLEQVRVFNDIIYIIAVNPVVEVADIQREIVVVHQFDVVYLFVYVLVPLAVLRLLGSLGVVEWLAAGGVT